MGDFFLSLVSLVMGGYIAVLLITGVRRREMELLLPLHFPEGRFALGDQPLHFALASLWNSGWLAAALAFPISKLVNT